MLALIYYGPRWQHPYSRMQKEKGQRRIEGGIWTSHLCEKSLEAASHFDLHHNVQSPVHKGIGKGSHCSGRAYTQLKSYYNERRKEWVSVQLLQYYPSFKATSLAN